MVYSWKIPSLYPIEAQQAGEELSRIHNQRGCLTPKAIVDESRPEDAALHPVFEWDDWKAAENWREQQARQLVCCIVTQQETEKREPVEVRAFVHVQDSYQPVQVALTVPDMRAEVLKDTLESAEAFKRKLKNLLSVYPDSKEAKNALSQVSISTAAFSRELSKIQA